MTGTFLGQGLTLWARFQARPEDLVERSPTLLGMLNPERFPGSAKAESG